MSDSAFSAFDVRGHVDDSPMLNARSQESDATSASSQPLLSRRQTLLLLLISALVALAAIVLSVLSVTFVISHSSSTSTPGSTPAVTATRGAADIKACIAQHSTFQSTYDAPPRAADNSTPAILIKNALIHDGFKSPFQGDVLLEGGVIKSVQAGSIARPSASTRVIDVQGRHVTPGIVDAHSHVGVSAFPTDYVATSDTNEGTNPIFPQVRAVDAVDVQDPAIALVRSGGVTTVQILPGSGNAMGGEGVLMKLKNTTYVDDFLIQGAPHLLKMACGENPKRAYGRAKGVTPLTRMGAAWIMRNAFEQATSLLNQQRAWCGAAEQPTTPFPDSKAAQALLALLRGTARLHTHCYTPTDFAMMMRLTDEFNFTVSAFHHAMGAHTIPETIKARNITVATFADQWGHKYEQVDSSVYQGQRLEKAGIAVALKSDHPVFNSEYLVFEGVKSHAWGLSYNGAIAALTSTPAQALGLSARVGAIRAGLDADLVVWDIDPLTVGARPLKVIIDGVVYVDGDTDAAPELADSAPGAPLTCAEGSQQQTLSCYAIVDVLTYAMTNSSSRAPQDGLTVVVVDGVVQCVGGSCTVPAGCTRYSPQSGVIIPGLIEAGSHIGQLEYVQETRSQDGTNDGASVDGTYSTVSAFDGLHVYGRHLDASRRGGVTVAINPPLVGNQLVVGLSTAVLTRTTTNNSNTSLFAEHNLVQHRVALHLSLGNSAKNSGLSNSISGQFAALRALFDKAAKAANATSESDPLWAFQQVLLRSLPLSVDVNAADQISALLRLQRQYGFRLIVQGAAEAHLLAAELAATTPPTAVVFTSRPVPSTFETRRVRYDAFSVLKAADVPVGLQYADPNLSMNLRWELAFQRRFNRLSTYDVLEAATTNIVQIFGIGAQRAGQAAGRITGWADGLGQIKVGTKANFLLFNGDPLSADTKIQLLAVGTDVECRPVLF